jgi:glycosyltransferase involved in cell wall biosynthesis
MKASVLIVTYNQQDLIGQAIESALSQVTDFDYEIVVADDCSTDRTRSVACGYCDRFPDRVRVLIRERNLGLMGNLPQAFLECRGDYVACLDGDDYWTGSEKLQRQVDFLDAHPDYSICFHNALMVWDDSSEGPTLHSPPGRRSTYHLDELLVHDFISTSAAVVRNHLVRAFPDWYARFPVPDWPFFVLHAMHGKIGYLDADWSVYRQHAGGAYSPLAYEKQREQNIAIIRLFRESLGPEWRTLLTDAAHSRCLSLALHYRRLGNKSRARKFARMARREVDSGLLGSLRMAAKVFTYMHVPALYDLVSQGRAALHAKAAAESATQDHSGADPHYVKA